MKKGINIVVLGVLTVVSVILALPFTPLRNSFKGVATNAADKALTSMGVDFNGKIKNARMIAGSHQYEGVYYDLSENLSAKAKLHSADYSALKGVQSDEGYYTIAENLGKNQSSNGMLADLGQLNTSKNGNRVVSASIRGFVSISSNVKTSNSSSGTGTITKQSGNAQNDGSGGGTHPGVDPTPPLGSLALGNGFVCLFAFALGYVGLKEWD